MFDKLRQLDQHYSVLQAKLNAPETYNDPKLVAELNRELRELEEVVTAYRSWEQWDQSCRESETLLRSEDPELRELAKEEYYEARSQREDLEKQLQILLIPRDPDDDKSVIVEIRAGVGGEEAALFAHSLCRMYGMYGMKRGWKQELAGSNQTELGGMKEVTFTMEGAGAYARLKYESGVHRVQRVPETESGGRVHTSTVTVAVLPEVDDVTFELDRNDLRIDTFRSSGAGGSTSTKLPLLFASPICLPVWWWSARTSGASSRIRRRPCRCCAPGSISRRCGSSRIPSRRNAAARWEVGCGMSAFAPIISHRAG